MNIIIAGCGKVGTTLGEQLVRERHEVTFIDTAPELLKKVMGMIDVQVIEGNCTVYSTLKEAGIEHADLFIAVTDSDEINLLSCLIAKKHQTVIPWQECVTRNIMKIFSLLSRKWDCR